MRWVAVLACCTLLGAAEIAGSKVESVYLMPMAGGMDQYLAHQLTRSGTLSVVTDVKRADAIFTDRLGEAFQAQLEKWYAEPKPAAAAQDAKAEAAAAEKKDDKDDKDKKDAVKKDDKKDAVEKKDGSEKTAGAPPPTTSFGHGKGTLFLVDGKSRRVLWSAYQRPKNSSADEMERTASHIVGQLTKQLTGK